MDNQQDQFEATASGNAGRNSQNPAASTRKSTSTPSAQSFEATPNASAQNTTNASTERQGEGPQANNQEGTILDTALNSGKKWIEDSGMLDSVNQLPQSVKDLGNRALDKVNGLSTTQKIVGGAILAAGIGWLATRKVRSSSSSDDSSESSPYNYGRQRDAGSYGRRSYGYQAPDASTSRPTASGASNRSDSGAPYGNSSRYGGSSSSFTGNTGIQAGSGRPDSSSAHASAHTDHGQRSKDDGFRSIE
jgi:hypothetical protein